jgi:hypothetical protein
MSRTSIHSKYARETKCPCGCCHATDYGACPEFEEGGNGRCVYCDHAEPCHERDKNRRFYNGPIYAGERTGQN